MRQLITPVLITALALGTAVAAEAGWDEGVKAYQSGNYSVAAQEFQAVVSEREDWADGHFMLGQALLKMNRKQDATQSLRKAYDLKPSEVRYQLALAQAYVSSGKYQDASRLLERVQTGSLSSSQQKAYHQLSAIAAERSGNAGQALAALRNSARQSPNDASIQTRYGVTAFNAGETAEAVRALERAVSVEATPERRQAYAKALVRQARENPSTKQTSYRKAVEQAKVIVQGNASYDNLLFLGEAHLGAKQYAEAASAFERAIGKRSSDWLGHFYLSQAQTSLGRYGAAEASLRKAIAAGPSGRNENMVYKQLGFVNEKLKKYEEAKTAYMRAGDAAAANRVDENRRIAEENQQIDAENREIERMEAEQERLRRELEELGGPPPRW